MRAHDFVVVPGGGGVAHVFQRTGAYSGHATSRLQHVVAAIGWGWIILVIVVVAVALGLIGRWRSGARP